MRCKPVELSIILVTMFLSAITALRRKRPEQVPSNYTLVLEELKIHREVTVAINVMFTNRTPFFVHLQRV